MDTLTLLQHYWWFIISLLGALLVFLLFVQGGQALLYTLGRNEAERELIIASLGRKWELTFTTLVTFGGAFFASFPLFYSTSFGGAYYVWTAILLAFVIQAVSYEYRRKAHNFLGEKTFNAFLLINGVAAPLLLGVAVGTFYTGANFTVDRLSLANGLGGECVISQWTSPWHGLEAVADYRNVLLGVSVVMLSLILGCQYLISSVENDTVCARARRVMLSAASVFVPLFVVWLLVTFSSEGFGVTADGIVMVEAHKYFSNLIDIPMLFHLLWMGVVAVLASLYVAWKGRRWAIHLGGMGTVFTVLALLLCVGWGDTSYYASQSDLSSSLTICNSSSSLFTLRTMAYVSIFVPFVAGYIGYVWYKMDSRRITRDDVEY